MHISLKIKMGPFLVISSVLAVWTLLAVRVGSGPRQNSTPPRPQL